MSTVNNSICSPRGTFPAEHSAQYLYQLEYLEPCTITLVYPHILYGITLWSAAYEIPLSKVNVLHKKIIRSMCNVNYNDHINELFVQSGILKLHDTVRHQLGVGN